MPVAIVAALGLHAEGTPMETVERAKRIEAPFDRVWEFHAGVDGLAAITPAAAGLEVLEIDPPQERPLTVGTRLHLRVRPGFEFVSEITARSRDGRIGMFRDELREGPLEELVHTHWFVDLGEATLVYDHVRFSIPGPVPDRWAVPVVSAMFWDRHRRTARALEEHWGSEQDHSGNHL